MSPLFEITHGGGSSGEVTLDAKRRGELQYTARNLEQGPLNARATVVGTAPANASWTNIRPRDLDFDAGGTNSFTIKILVPRNIAPGTYSFRVLLSDNDDPDDRYTEGPPFSVTVPEEAPARKPFPWWILGVVGGVVLLVLLIVMIIVLLPGSGPKIKKVTDVTGGRTVIGDLVDIEGRKLTDVTVTIGGVKAPIVSTTGTDDERVVRVRVPVGIPAGEQSLEVARDDKRDAAKLEITRLAVALVSQGRNTGRVVVIDTTDHSVVRSLPPTTVSTNNWPLVMGWANGGSLALVPMGTAAVSWVDLTADPPNASIFNTNATQALGVAVSPDHKLAVVNDRQGSALISLEIEVANPPYNSIPVGVKGRVTYSSFPRTPLFVDNDHLIVPVEGHNQIGVLQRSGPKLSELSRAATDTYPLLAALVPSSDSDVPTVIVSHYTGRTLNRFVRAGAGVKSEAKLEHPSLFGLAPVFAPGDQGLVYALWGSGPSGQLWAVKAEGLQKQEALDLGAFGHAVALAVDPGEGRFAYVGRQETLQLVELDGTKMELPKKNPFEGVIEGGVYGVSMQP